MPIKELYKVSFYQNTPEQFAKNGNKCVDHLQLPQIIVAHRKVHHFSLKFSVFVLSSLMRQTKLRVKSQKTLSKVKIM